MKTTGRRERMTTGGLRAIRELNGEGLYDSEIAERLGVSKYVVFYWRSKLGLPHVRWKKKTQYAVYLRETDELLAVGTAEECAKAAGLTLASFRSMASRTMRGLEKKYEVVRVEEGSGEE